MSADIPGDVGIWVAAIASLVALFQGPRLKRLEEEQTSQRKLLGRIGRRLGVVEARTTPPPGGPTGALVMAESGPVARAATEPGA